MKNPTSRFSDRVENYIKYRPSYPHSVLTLLKTECGLTRDWVIADIGSGTGILSRLLLENGNRVFAVEPNAEMREAAEQSIGGNPLFTSVAATAEETGLATASADLIVAAQAFHWFDAEKCRAEFPRILKPGGWVALIWNERLVEATPFLRAYEDLLHRHATDYGTVDHRNVGDETIGSFFQPGGFRFATFANVQRFDYSGLKGRCLSSSYTPPEGSAECASLILELDEIFNRHQRNEIVSFEYKTNVYFGRLLH